MNKYNDLPWAALYVGPAARRLTAGEAILAFGEYLYDDQTIYVSCGDGFARRIISEDYARANGLAFIFTGITCQNEHIAPRRLRTNGTPECTACRRAYKRRARLRKQAVIAA